MTATGAHATIDDFRRMAEKLSNWGRWGAEDQIGTLNFITPEKLKQAAASVKQGKVFPLGIDFNADGPGHAYRRSPIHLMSVDGGDEKSILDHLPGWGGTMEAGYVGAWQAGPLRWNDDYIIMALQCGTQWDALSHVYYDSKMYNGFPASAVTSQGATKCSIDQVDVKGVVSRGVLLDVAHHRGVPHLPENTGVLPEELDEVAKAQGVTIESGDIVIVRTGWWSVFEQTHDSPTWIAGSPGLSWRCAEWLHDREAAAVAVDNIACEVSSHDVEGVGVLPLHLLCIRDMGMMLGEMWSLEALSRDCAQDGQYTFQVCAASLRVTGAVGSPINPIAIK
jgi:kynurenine formamidase